MHKQIGQATTNTSGAARRIIVNRHSSLLLPRPGESVHDKQPRTINPRLAIYGRRSERTDTSSSLSRQERALKAMVKTMDGTFDPAKDLYFDDDISAKGGKFRPGVESLLRAIEAEEYDGVLVWEFSRWTRNRRENRIMTDLMRKHGCELYSHEEKWLSLYGHMGFFVEWAADLAARESERISSRVVDWHAHKSHVGVVHARAPFGMRKFAAPSPFPDRKADVYYLEPDEEPRSEYEGQSAAELVRAAFIAVSTGGTPYTVAREWNRRGWPSPQGKLWTATMLRRLLGNAELTGFATWHGDPVLTKDGERVAPHRPLVSIELFGAVRERVAVTGKFGARTDSPMRGLLRCAACGGTMVWGGTASTHRYMCNRLMSPNCPQPTSIHAGYALDGVLTAVSAVLDDEKRLHELLSPAGNADDKRAQARTDLTEAQRSLLRLEEEQLAGGFSDPGGPDRYRQHKERYLQKSREADAALFKVARMLPDDYHEQLATCGTALAALHAMPATTRLHLLRQLVDHISVATGVRGRKFDPNRMTIQWRTS